MKIFDSLPEILSFLETEATVYVLEGLEPPHRIVSQCPSCKKWYDIVSSSSHPKSCIKEYAL